MAHEQHSPTFLLRYVLHLSDGFLLEFSIAHSKDFIHHKNLRVEVCGYSKTQTHHHTTGITLHRSVNITLAARETDNFIQLSRNLSLGHPKYSPIHIDILTTRQFSMKSCPHF